MSSNNPFRVLGLDATTATERDVKKAYSQKLKVTRPDEDREAFMVLQQAYKQARSQAQNNDNNRKRQQEEAEAEHGNENANNASTLRVEASQNEDLQDVANKPQEQVKYWYDKELNYHFNSSPVGKLIEKTIRWLIRERGRDPATFFDQLAREPALRNKQNFIQYSNFLLQRINWEAGGEEFDYYGDIDEQLDSKEELKAPDWLTNEAKRVIEDKFSFSSRVPNNGWEAKLLNNINVLFKQEPDGKEPVDESAMVHDVEKFHAKSLEKTNKDQFGSYYDFDKHQWIDMSPASVAMRDIDEAIASPWGISVDTWREILEREEIQSIDEYQNIDRQLRWKVINASGFGKEKKPQLPRWLNVDSLKYLETHFGWSHQNSRNIWEHDQIRWMHQMLEASLGKQNLLQSQMSGLKTPNPEAVSKNSFAYLGYQPLPLVLRPTFLLVGYALYRMVQVFFRLV